MKKSRWSILISVVFVGLLGIFAVQSFAHQAGKTGHEVSRHDHGEDHGEGHGEDHGEGHGEGHGEDHGEDHGHGHDDQ